MNADQVLILVEDMKQTCYACPMLFEGESTYGDAVCVKYRYDTLSLWVNDEKVYSLEYEGKLDWQLAFRIIEHNYAIRLPLHPKLMPDPNAGYFDDRFYEFEPVEEPEWTDEDQYKYLKSMKNPPHPGRGLQAEFGAKGWNVGLAMMRTGSSSKYIQKVLCGKNKITHGFAAKLEQNGIGTQTHWIAMQETYDKAQEAQTKAAEKVEDKICSMCQGDGKYMHTDDSYSAWMGKCECCNGEGTVQK